MENRQDLKIEKKSNEEKHYQQETSSDHQNRKREKQTSERRVHAGKKKTKKQLKISDHTKKKLITTPSTRSTHGLLKQSLTQTPIPSTLHQNVLPPPPIDLPPPLPFKNQLPPNDLPPPPPSSNTENIHIPPPPKDLPPPPILNSNNNVGDFKAELFAAVSKRAMQPQANLKSSLPQPSIPQLQSPQPQPSQSHKQANELQAILSAELVEDKKSRNYRGKEEPKKISRKKKKPTSNVRVDSHKLRVVSVKPVESVAKHESSFFCCCRRTEYVPLQTNDAKNDMEVEPFLKSRKK